MCFISLTYARQKVVDYSLVQFDQLSYISLAPGLASRQWIIINPFNIDVWLYSIASSVMLAIFMYFIYRIETKLKLSSKCFSIEMGNDAREAKWGTIVINLYATFMKQRKEKAELVMFDDQQTFYFLAPDFFLGRSDLIRYVYTIWLLVTLILSNSYCGCFYSILALPEFEPAIDSVNQLEALVLEDKVRVFTYANSSYLDSFIYATPDMGPLHTIGLLINRTLSETSMVYNDEQLIEQTEKLTSNKLRKVGIASALQLAFTRRVYSQRKLYIGSEAIGSDNSGFIFAKRSPFFEPFNRL